MKLALLAFLLTCLAACTSLRGTPSADVRMIAVGDSILDWNRKSGEDIPTLVAQQTGLPVFNNAISGAKFVGRFAVPRQYRSGDWDWVIVDGGGNDLTGNCDTPEAAEVVLDRLIDDEDLSGAYASFLLPITEQGTQVIIMGYVSISIAGGPFATCEFALNDLRDRQMKLANSNSSVLFMDTRDVIAPDNLAAYDADLIHPSPLGGALIAGLIAQTINGAR